MTQTIAIVNEKGGTGKTTTAVNLSAALGQLGRKVLLVDLDGQAASSRWLGVEEDTSFADALWRGEGLAPLMDIIPGVSLAPGSGKLDSVAHDLRPTQGGQLRKLLMQQKQFDHILIDCPPSLGNRLIGNALLAASHAVVPVECSILAMDGLKILLSTLDDIRDGFGHDIELAGVVACRFDARTKLSRMILAELTRALPGRVFKTVIRENVRLRECPASGKSIFAYAADSHAAEDYLNLGKEVLALLEQGVGLNHDAAPVKDEDLSAQEREAMAEIRQFVDGMLHRGKGKSVKRAEEPPPADEPAYAPAPPLPQEQPVVEAPAVPPVMPEPVTQTVAEEPCPPSEEPIDTSAQPAAQEAIEGVQSELPAIEVATPAPAEAELTEALPPLPLPAMETTPELPVAVDQPVAVEASPAEPSAVNLDWLKAEPADPFALANSQEAAATAQSSDAPSQAEEPQTQTEEPAEQPVAAAASGDPDWLLLKRKLAEMSESVAAETAPVESAATPEPVAENSPVAEETPDPAELPLAEESLSPAAETPEPLPAVAAEKEQPEAKPAKPAQGEPDYPALRAMLQKMNTPAGRANAKKPPVAAPQKQPVWRRLFKKNAG